MTTKEIREWLARAEGSELRWVEDEAFHMAERGSRYYHGGDEGVYIEVLPDSRMGIGEYAGGISHMDNELCVPVVQKRYTDSLAAFVKAAEFTDGQLIRDLTSELVVANAKEALIDATRQQGILFSRVQLWSDTSEEAEFFIPGALRCLEDLENYVEFVDFTEFISPTETKVITATVTSFTSCLGIL